MFTKSVVRDLNKKRDDLLSHLFFYHLSSDDTVSFLRPRRRRAANTRRPLGVDMRSRKPCLLRRLRSDGWNVLFISRYFYIFLYNLGSAKVALLILFTKYFLRFLNIDDLLGFEERVICPG